MIVISLTQTELLVLLLGFSILIAMIIGNQQYWKGKFESLSENQNDGSGWREEARFLRRLLNKSAAKDAENAEFKIG